MQQTADVMWQQATFNNNWNHFDHTQTLFLGLPEHAQRREDPCVSKR